MSQVSKKRLFFILFSISLLAYLFWTSSRYPQLDEKASMGEETPTMGISFDVVTVASKNAPIHEKIFWNTINWIDTNKKGMTFGLLFASCLILLFAQISEKQFKNRWLNTAIGMLLGAPLGVCVNCAAPIAKGIKDAGGRTETALATMISSPTLNVVVLSMLFALFPTYMVLIKLVFTAIVILVVIPTLTYFFDNVSLPSPNLIATPSVKFSFMSKDVAPFGENESWLGAFKWFSTNYLNSLWFIIKTAVPLMVLAGLLGNILITFLPLEEILRLIPTGSLIVTLLSLIVLALIGAFLPVPMAFDVVVVATLMAGGMSVIHAMPLLFTLGIFSVYSYFIVNKSVGFKLSTSLFLVIVVLGAFSGLVAFKWKQNIIDPQNKAFYAELKKKQLENLNTLKDGGNSLWQLPLATPSDIAMDAKDIHAMLKQNSFSEVPFKVPGFAILKKELQEVKTSEKWFEKVEGVEIGVNIPYKYSVHNLLMPFSNQRSIATGDIHQDGFSDLLIASADSIYLYANIDGYKFVRQKLPFSKPHILGCALVDFNNDGWLDVFITSFDNGNYLIFNHKGSFDSPHVVRLPQDDKTKYSHGVAFADIDKNGRLDLFLGNWYASNTGGYSIDSTHNYGYLNQGDNLLDRFDLKGNDGETLSLLFSDINMDGNIDLIEGNDFAVPDFYYWGNGAGGFDQLNHQDSIIPEIPRFTMSLTSADIDNDLIPEIYSVQTNVRSGNSTSDLDEICGCIDNKSEHTACMKAFKHWYQINKTWIEKNLAECPEEDKMACALYYLYRENYQLNEHRDLTKWKEFTRNLEQKDSLFRDYYISLDRSTHHRLNDYDSTWLQSSRGLGKGAVLLKKQRNNAFEYTNVAKELGIDITAWAWNAKFADLDNDEWQDLMIANGFLFFTKKQYSNILYQNQGGKRFQDVTDNAGLTNFLPTSSYAYTDFDSDGDIDIIVTPNIGPIMLYKNNQSGNNSIIFELTDSVGNSHGVGSKVFIEYGEEKHQYREILLSGGYKSYDETIAHFGLGKHKQVNKVIIEWSTGEKTVIDQPMLAGYRYKIVREKPSVTQ